MTDMLQIGVSGIRAFQQALATTSHNVANANTEGYTRQRAEFSARPTEMRGGHFIGAGVEVARVRRVYDELINTRLQESTSARSELETLSQMSDQVADLFAADTLDLSPSMDRFFGALQDASTQPESLPLRDVFLSQSQSMVARFDTMGQQLDSIRGGLNEGLANGVQEVNRLATEVADINAQIATMPKVARATANDLLDRRDQLIQEMGNVVGVRTLTQSDGSATVLLTAGQSLVVGNRSFQLDVAQAPMEPENLEVVYRGAGNSQQNLVGLREGSLGGLLRFRSEVVEPAQSALGRLTVDFAERFNAQHMAGMDHNGDLGQPFFSVAAPKVSSHPQNAGSAAVQVAIVDSSGLKASDYQLRFDGSDFQLLRESDGTRTTLSGAGPHLVDGLQIDIDTSGGAPALGDRFLVRPTVDAARSLEVLVTDSKRLALAAPVRSQVDAGNTGGATISPAEVIDSQDPALLDGVEILFNTPPNTFDVIDTGSGATVAAGVAYVSGNDIDVNGHRVNISGSPGAGDRFLVESNAGGIGDNRNALLLAGLASQDSLENGSMTLQEAYSQMVTEAGNAGRNARSGLDARNAVHEQLQATRDSISGVNLEEEAVNMIRLQESYQAAARIIAVADEMFVTILRAVGG